MSGGVKRSHEDGPDSKEPAKKRGFFDGLKSRFEKVVDKIEDVAEALHVDETIKKGLDKVEKVMDKAQETLDKTGLSDKLNKFGDKFEKVLEKVDEKIEKAVDRAGDAVMKAAAKVGLDDELAAAKKAMGIKSDKPAEPEKLAEGEPEKPAADAEVSK